MQCGMLQPAACMCYCHGRRRRALFDTRYCYRARWGLGGEVFFGEEHHEGFPQTLVLLGSDAVEEGQVTILQSASARYSASSTKPLSSSASEPG